MNEQQHSALYGPGAQYSDHRIGERIRFRDEHGQVTEDEIVYVIAPNEQQPLTYVMREANPNTGLPWLLYQSEILEGSEEPTLYQCSCGAMHNTGQACPLA
jgi:hypothetical protein